MEIFDIIDKEGNPTGRTVTREKAHAEGIPHRTAHIWIIRQKDNRIQVLLQKRSQNKDSGIQATPVQLQFAGTFPISFAKEFHGKLFRDEELAFVYIYSQPVNINDLVLQKEEVESVEWFDLEDTYEECQKSRDRFCVPSGGFEVVRKFLREKQV